MSAHRAARPVVRDECHQTRLAQSTVAAVDACDCGMLRLHIGALTLRLPPEAMRELAQTLSRAVAVHAGERFPKRDRGEEGAFGFRRERGDA
jgi:hypothetical protein